MPDTTSQTQSEHDLWVLAILCTLMAFASISTDLYLPAMPAMSASLHAPAGLLALTISGYLAGFAVGQLFWGPVSDRYGRRLPIAIGLLLFVLGSAGCALSASAVLLIGWRLVQALGASAGVVLGRAMVRDLYAGVRAARMMSLLMTVTAIAPLLGPLVGGQILLLASWRAIFWTLVGIGGVTLAALLTLPETLLAARRNLESPLRALASYGAFLRDRRLLAYAGTGAFLYAGLFANVAASPFAYITYYHVAPQLYGLLFAGGILGIMAMNMTNARLVGRFTADRMLQAGACVAALAGLAAAIDARTGFGGLIGLLLPILFFMAMMGLIAANAISGALEDFPHRAGAVSAFIGATQYGGGIAGSALVGAFADGTPWPLGWALGLGGTGCLACALLLSSRTLSLPSKP